MLKLSDEHQQAFANAVEKARKMHSLSGAVGAIYADFETRREERKPVCDRSGKCCRFEAYRHRLFVTTMEVVAFANRVRIDQTTPIPDWDGTGCPYQVSGLCSAHNARPFGCRVYFCDPTASQWQQDEYEVFHRRLRELHDQSGVDYWYVEWREALASIGLAKPSLKGRSLPIL